MMYHYVVDLKILEQLSHDLRAFGDEKGLSEKQVFALNLSLEEVMTNIITHGYHCKKTGDKIDLELLFDENMITAVVTDHGLAFDPLQNAPEPDLYADVDERKIGGLGVFLCKEMMDAIEYQWLDGKNVLILRTIFCRD